MAAGDSCYKLVVGNLPDSMIDDDFLLSLFFESTTACPDGGDVENIEMHPNHRKAVVTFEDFEVVNRLLKCKTVIFQDSVLTIQSFKNDEVDNKENLGDANDNDDDNDNDEDDDNEGGSCKSHDSKDENGNGSENEIKDDTSESSGKEDADHHDDNEAEIDEDAREVDVDAHLKQLSTENLSEIGIEPDEGDHDDLESVKNESSDEFLSLGEDEAASDIQLAEVSAEFAKVHIEGSTEFAEKLTEGSTEFAKVHIEGSTEFAETLAEGNTESSEAAHINLPHSSDNSGNVSETDLLEEQKNETMVNQLQTTAAEDKDEIPLHPEDEKLEYPTPTSTEQLRKDNTVLPEEIKTDEVKLPNEKVKLLKILADARLLSESVVQSVTNFDTEHGKVILAGTEEDIMNAKLDLYENANIMSNFRVEMRKQTSDLLFTVRGIQWLEKEFQQRQINAVLYQKDNDIDMVASDDNSYDAATKVLQEVLAVKVITFQDDHLEYLRSAIWKKSMEEFSSKEIIHIGVDFTSSEITVEGHADSVKLIHENISALLITNSKVTTSIKLRKGSLRLLKEHSNAVQKAVTDALKSLGDWRVELEYKEACIELRGTREAVVEANRVLSDKYLSSIQHLPYEVNMAGVTIDAFTTKDSFGEDIIYSLEMKHKCVVEVRERDLVPSNADGAKKDSVALPPVTKAVESPEAVGMIGNVKAAMNYIADLSGIFDPKPNPPASTSTPDVHKVAANITIQTGSLVDFQADVLVNPVAQDTRRLAKAGAVAKSFSDKGKDVLQQEFDQVGSPREFGGAISVTSNAAGVFPCKKIYHVAIRRFRDRQSIELLRKMIEGCLKKAEGESMTSIAFPTVGCGKLSYDLKDVVRCFNETALNSTLQVYIIGYEQATCDAFESYLTQPILKKPQEKVQEVKVKVSQPKPAPPPPATQASPVTVPPSTAADPSLFRKAIVFHIVALDKTTAERARSNLAQKLADCLADVNVERELIANLSDDMINTIRKIPCASKIDIRIDKQNKTIQLRGHHVSVRQTKVEIDKLLAEEEKNHNDLQFIKRTKGVAAYLAKLAATENLQLPKYWTHYRRHDQTDTGSVKTALQPGTEVYKAVEAIVMGTWEAGKVGQGHDAASLSHSSILIKNIFVVENLSLFHNYKSQLKNLSYRSSRNQFKPVTSLQGEAEIATKSLPGVNYLYDELVGEINEYYLLHGTSHQETVATSGIDFRFSGERVLFGKGAYFAEKSIKADQYADPKDKRKPIGEKLYMYVARVLLGEPHLCQKPYMYKKAPCSDASCKNESCSSGHLPCDSVIGTHKVAAIGNSVRLLFREFVIYHMDQCYPEFLVEYVRQ